MYDAVYVTLAEHLDTVLYTADNELIRNFPRRVLHVRGYTGRA